MDKTMLPITGLWEQTDKNGNPYFSGTLGSSRLMIFKNNYKREEKHPDFIMYLAEKKKKEVAKEKETSTTQTEMNDFVDPSKEVPWAE